MKAAKASMEFLAKADPKTGKQVTSAGERLAGIYENMMPYWRARDAADAVKFSEGGQGRGDAAGQCFVRQ